MRIRVIHVKESKGKSGVEGNIIYVAPASEIDLNKAINQIFELLDTSKKLIPLVDIDNDRSMILSNYLQLEKENSISKKHPDLMLDWNAQKNDKLNPEYISYASEKKVWWKCHICGYEWQTTVASRSAGNGCALCAGQVVVSGINDLATCVPELLSEWDYEKNNDISPTQVASRSPKKVWWKCSFCGANWQALISNRARGLSYYGCPDCARKQMQMERDDKHLRVVGSLAENYPELIAEWDYERNEIDPSQVTSHSGKKAYWKCKKCGNKWCTAISNRTAGHGCRICNARLGALKRKRLIT